LERRSEVGHGAICRKSWPFRHCWIENTLNPNTQPNVVIQTVGGLKIQLFAGVPHRIDKSPINYSAACGT
jgi:hypothetical protein